MSHHPTHRELIDNLKAEIAIFTSVPGVDPSTTGFLMTYEMASLYVTGFESALNKIEDDKYYIEKFEAIIEQWRVKLDAANAKIEELEKAHAELCVLMTNEAIGLYRVQDERDAAQSREQKLVETIESCDSLHYLGIQKILEEALAENRRLRGE